MPNILPPGAETFLKESEERLLKSALMRLYEAVMIDYSTGKQLSEFSNDLGFPRPPILFSNDDKWRAVVRAAAFHTRHTKDGVRRIFEIIMGPIKSQVTTLDRTTYASVKVGDTLTISNSLLGTNNGTYTVTQVRMHELVFDAGTFNKEDSGVSYTINGTIGKKGFLTTDSEGNDILRDVLIPFINTHNLDFLSKVQPNFPQYGKIIFNKNSTTDETTSVMKFYDKLDTGILKIREAAKFTRNKYMPIQSSTLAADVAAKATSLIISDSTNFPTNSESAQAVTAGSDQLVIITPAPIAGTYNIASASGDTIILDAGTPMSVTTPVSGVTYSINAHATLELKGTNVAGTIYGSKSGKAASPLRFVDDSKNFSKKIDADRFAVTINRGEATEETIEVANRSGNTLNLVINPNKHPIGAESFLKYKHFDGETIEIAHLSSSTTSDYFVIDAAGNDEGTADAGSTKTVLVDSAAAFVLPNQSSNDGVGETVLDGDEVEITDEDSDLFGQICAIKKRDSATQLTLDPGFPLTMAGLKYKIRKKYKPTKTADSSNDNKIYVADGRGFPKENFSIILDRGTPKEEVLWISSNTVFSNNRGVFTIANSDSGTAASPVASVSKKHDFGMTVEAAQVLMESCGWNIMETKATGEFTIAYTPECVSDLGVQAFYLHEKIDSSKFKNTVAEEVEVALTKAVSAGASEISVDISELSDAIKNTVVRQNQINRSVNIVDATTSSTNEHAFLTKESTYTNIVNNPDYYNSDSADFYRVPGNYTDPDSEEVDAAGLPLVKKDRIVVKDASNYTVGDAITLAKYGEGTEESLTIASIDTTTEGLHIVKFTSNMLEKHFIGDSVQKTEAIVQLASPLKNSYLINSKMTLLFNEDTYAHESNLIGQVNAASGGTTTTLIDFGRTFHETLIGQVISFATTGGSATKEERVITGVSGSNNNTLEFSPALSTAVSDGDSYSIKSMVQTGDVHSPDINGESYFKGNKSVFPGAYIYGGPTVNQPTSTISQLAKEIDTGKFKDGTSKKQAMIKIPAPQKLIATPKVSKSSVGNNATGLSDKTTIFDNSVDFASTVAVGDEVEIIGPVTSPNYKSKTTITKVEADHIVLAGFKYDLETNDIYRVHGNFDSNTPVFDQNTAEKVLYIDDATLFPSSEQNPFSILVGSVENGDIEQFEVLAVDNQLGIITLAAGTTSIHPHYVGDRVALVVKYLALQNVPIDFPDSGGIYLDYGYRGNNLYQDTLNFSGTADTVQLNVMVDADMDFLSSFGKENHNALLGYKIKFTSGPISGEVVTINDVFNNNTLKFTPGVNAATNVTYEIFSDGATTLLDRDTFKSTIKTGQVGGILTDLDVGAVGFDLPSGEKQLFGTGQVGGIRYGGAVQEYVEFVSRDGNVIELKEKVAGGKVFEHSHPAGTRVTVGSGQFTTKGDGTDYRPFIRGKGFFDVLFNSYLTKFPQLIRAAGIKIKAEETEASN